MLAVVALTGAFLTGASTASALSLRESQSGPVTTGLVKAADLSQFRPGNIISDEVFFNAASMTEAQVDSFLRQKVSTCRSGYTCLKDYRETTFSRSADSYCRAYSGEASESAARIVFKVAQACGINPQVLIVTLEKEQGLVTHTWPSDWRYTIAMGQGCPDTAECDKRYYGFYNQVYGAARQFKIYTEGRYFTYYAPGKTWNIRYSPNAACGSSPVYIENQATANLYYYTPYQPNAASLRAGYGEGDSCSTYGNRNFFQRFTDWFGSPSIQVVGALNSYWQAQGASSGWVGSPSAPMWSWSGQGWSQRFSGADLYLKANESTVRATIGGTRDEYRLVGEAASGLGWPSGPVLAAGGGWYQDFGNGRIYVRPSDGRGFAVASPINQVYESAGNINGVLGWPTSRAYRYENGSRQDFDKGSVFQGPTATVAIDAAWTSAFTSAGGPAKLGWPLSTGSSRSGNHAVFTAGMIHRPAGGAALVVRGEIFRGYSRAGGITGALGAPVENEQNQTGSYSQRFEGGTVYATTAGTFAVTKLSDALAKFGGVATLGYPTAQQVGSGASYSQDFGSNTLTVGSNGAFIVGGVIGRTYRSVGGASSSLGAAVGPERAMDGGFIQDFEKGRIYCNSAATIVVPAATTRIHDNAGGVQGRLGWPTAPASSSSGEVRQPFQGGEVWISADGSSGAAVIGAVLQTARIAGGIATLGTPTGAELESPEGWRQEFARGVVFVPRAGLASAAVGSIFANFKSAGGLNAYGFATGPATGIAPGATMQPFAKATVYSSSHGTFATRGYLRTFHSQWGGADGVLGLPRQNEYATAGGYRQDFAGGSALVSAAGAFIARGALGAEYLRRGGETGPLGWPLGNEISGDGRWQQRFQGGTLVLLANGTYRVE